jgi:hypothetical protein
MNELSLKNITFNFDIIYLKDRMLNLTVRSILEKGTVGTTETGLVCGQDTTPEETV